MEGDFLKKLFIFVGVIFFILMLGPYFGLHPLGTPTVPRSAIDRMKRNSPKIPALLPDDDEMIAVPREAIDESLEELDIIDDYEDTGE